MYRHAVQGIARRGTADGFFLIGGRFAFGEAAGLLVDGLPPVAVVKSGSEQAAVLSWPYGAWPTSWRTPRRAAPS